MTMITHFNKFLKYRSHSSRIQYKQLEYAEHATVKVVIELAWNLILHNMLVGYLLRYRTAVPMLLEH